MALNTSYFKIDGYPGLDVVLYKGKKGDTWKARVRIGKQPYEKKLLGKDLPIRDEAIFFWRECRQNVISLPSKDKIKFNPIWDLTKRVIQAFKEEAEKQGVDFMKFSFDLFEGFNVKESLMTKTSCPFFQSLPTHIGGKPKHGVVRKFRRLQKEGRIIKG